MTDPMELAGLIERLEKAQAGSRELDLEVAKALFGFSLWKSKHGYWNVSWGKDWPYKAEPDSSMAVFTLTSDWNFDPHSGEKLRDVEPMDWADRIDCPDFTTSLDAALALAERVLPGDRYVLLNIEMGGPPQYAHVGDNGPAPELREVEGHGKTTALALCIAILKAKAQGGGE